MEEEMVVLAKTKFTPSTKYGESMCIAGITDSGNFRRIYPIPYKDFMKTKFQKRDWIQYETREDDNSDTRKESVKIKPESIKIIKKEDFESFNRLVFENSGGTLEYLRRRYGVDKTSLGIVKVKELIDLKIKRGFVKKYKKGMHINPIDIEVKYRWKCYNPHCKGHVTLLLDSEFIGLYLNLRKKGLSESEIDEKLRDKFFDWMKTRSIYFMMGSHYIHRTHFMIISVFYPEYQGELLDNYFEL